VAAFADTRQILLGSLPGYLSLSPLLKSLTVYPQIIDNKSEFTHSQHGIHVVPQEEYIACRYLLVNPSGDANATTITIPDKFEIL
jgi:hypothetical protein